MSALEEDIPRLAEIHRSIQDFRSEFREAMKMMVRRDVYEANMQTFALRIENTERAVGGLEQDLEAFRKEREATRNSNRSLAIGLAVPGILSLIGMVIGLLK